MPNFYYHYFRSSLTAVFIAAASTVVAQVDDAFAVPENKPTARSSMTATTYSHNNANKSLEPPKPDAELRRVREGFGAVKTNTAAQVPQRTSNTVQTDSTARISFNEELPQPRRLNDNQTAQPLPSPRQLPKPVTQASFQQPPPVLDEEPSVIDNTTAQVPPLTGTTEAHADDAILDKPLKKRRAKESADTEADVEGVSAAETQHGWKNKIPRPDWNMSFSPVISVAGSLLIVLSAFFLIAILYKKVSPKGNRPLPKEAFENLGRVYITAKQQLQLLRLGNRLILVSVTASGTSPVCEITDPDEAVSLLGMCRRLDTNSATELFQKTVAKISDDEINQSVRASRRPPQRHSRAASPLVDLYSDPDETLAEMLAKSGRR